MKTGDQSYELVADVQTVVPLLFPNSHAQGEFEVFDLAVLVLQVLLSHPEALKEDEARELRLRDHPLQAALEELEHRLVYPKLHHERPKETYRLLVCEVWPHEPQEREQYDADTRYVLADEYLAEYQHLLDRLFLEEITTPLNQEA